MLELTLDVGEEPARAEAKEILSHKVDVIVCDGFTGNVIVKLSEGLLSFLAKYLIRQFTGGWLNKLALALMIPGAILMLPGLLLSFWAVARMSPTRASMLFMAEVVIGVVVAALSAFEAWIAYAGERVPKSISR